MFSCKKEGEKGTNLIKSAELGVEKISDEIVFNEDNFKDGKKEFNFLGERFTGIKKTVLVSNMFYSAAILPKEYYIKKYLKQKDSLEEYLDKLKREEVIQFDFQNYNGKDLFSEKTPSEVEELVKYLSFQIKNDYFAITSQGDTIPAEGVLFERTFKLTPYKRILLYFKFPEEQQELKLVYLGKIFDNQLLKFYLEK